MIPPAFVAWRACTLNRVVVTARQLVNRFLGSLKGLQILAQRVYTVKNCFARFLSLVGMSLIKVSLDRNNLPIICQNFNVAGQEFYQGVFLQFYYLFLDGNFPD